MKSSKRVRYIIYSVSLILIIIFIIYNQYPKAITDEMRSEGNMSSATYHGMSLFAAQIQLYAENTKKEISNDYNDMVQVLKGYNDGDSITLLNELLGQDLTKGYYDLWHTRIKLLTKSSKEYIFISAGPNKKFEDGKGDDITYSFNPYEFVQDKKLTDANKSQ